MGRCSSLSLINITIKLYHPPPLTNQRLTSQWTTFHPSTNPDNGTIHLIRHNNHYDLLLPQKDQDIGKEKERNKEKDTSKATEKDTNRTRAKGSNKNNERHGHTCITNPNDEEQHKENKKTKDKQLKNKQQGHASGTITRSSLRKKQ